MIINGNIFKDAININDKIENLKDIDEESAIDQDVDYYDIKLKIAKMDADPEDVKSMDSGHLMEDTWGDGALQLWFVPDDSLLANGLRDYYSYIDAKYHLNYGGYLDEIPHFARSAVVVSQGNDDNPTGQDGFFFVTGLGYSITDELFAGVSKTEHADSMHDTGSGVPFKKFLYFLNFIDGKDESAHDKKLRQHYAYQEIK